MGLTVKQVDKLIRDAKPGATADGDGLYLKITPTGNASWQYRYQINGKRRMMGLGACSQVSLLKHATRPQHPDSPSRRALTRSTCRRLQ